MHIVQANTHVLRDWTMRVLRTACEGRAFRESLMVRNNYRKRRLIKATKWRSKECPRDASIALMRFAHHHCTSMCMCVCIAKFMNEKNLAREWFTAEEICLKILKPTSIIYLLTNDVDQFFLNRCILKTFQIIYADTIAYMREAGLSFRKNL